MRWPEMFLLTSLLLLTFVSPALRAQTPAEELAPLTLTPSPGSLDALRSLSQTSLSARTAAVNHRPPYFWRSSRHPLTPQDVALREAVRTLGPDKHRFVRCELKSRAVVTGAISWIGDEGFFVRTGIMDSGQSIRYADLSAPPQPVAAVGAHLKNGFEWTGLVGLCVVLSPLVVVFYPLVIAGVIQD